MKSKLEPKQKRWKSGQLEAKQWFSQMRMQQQLLLILIPLLVISLFTIGLVSYFQSEKTTVQIIEDRIEREVQTTSEIAKTLKLAYITQPEKYNEFFLQALKDQQTQFVQDELDATFFIVKDSGTEWPIKKGGDVPLPESTVSELQTNEKGLVHMNWKGEPYTVSYFNIQEVGGVFGIAVMDQSFMAPLLKLRWFLAIACLVSVLAGIAIIYVLVRKMTTPIRTLQETMQSVRDGRWQDDIDIKASNIEVKELIKTYQVMISEVKSIFERIRKTSDKLNTTSGQLKLSADESKGVQTQLIHSIETVQAGANNTASSSEGTMNAYQEMSEHLTGLIRATERVNEASSNMKNQAVQGETSMEQSMSSIEESSANIADVKESMKRLHLQISTTTEMISGIKGVASQIKLLALNASIEAARAGEEGRGFSIVAEEIGKLAEQTTTTAEKIIDSVNSMEDLSGKTTNVVHELVRVGDKQQGMANKTVESFQALLSTIHETGLELQTLSSGLHQFKGILPELQSSTEQMTAISQETLSSAIQMISTAQEQDHQLNILHHTGEQLLSISNELTQVSDHVKVS